MGQSNNCQSAPNGQYSLVRDLPNGSIVKQHSNNQLHFLKQYSFTNQQAYQQAFVNFSKKLPDKHQHVLFMERTNTKLENTFCSTFYKISLLYQYLDHTLHQQIQERNQQNRLFDERDVWSVLCSCVLGVCEMIRAEGRSHAALKTKDIRLNEDGLVKLLSLEMIGLDSDHDLSKEASTKQLAITILNCLLMEEITNDSQDFLEEIIEHLESTSEMKTILKMMIGQEMKFIELEDYLLRMAQEETDSLNSYSNTPNLKDKNHRCENSYSKIPEESKEDDSLMTMPRDQEDVSQQDVEEPFTSQEEIPDENDMIDDSNSKNKFQESNQNTIRENNTPKMSIRESRTDNLPFCQGQETSLFTDPRLLNLIHTDLEEIKKRKSTTNSRKLGISESKFTITEQKQESKTLKTQYLNINNPIESKQNQIPFSYARNQSQQHPQQQFRHINLNSISSLPTIPLNNNTPKEESKIHEQSGWNSQKQLPPLCTNPQRKQNFEKQYDNIMDIEDMGFKKSKPKPREEESRVSHNVHNSHVAPTVIYNSSESSHIQEGKVPITNYLEKSRENQQQSRSKGNELEYVTETYIRGRYEGTKLSNMRHGKGVFYYNEGGKYIGEWKENKMYGKGVLYYPNNQIAYDGEWKNDQLQGKGTLYNQQVLRLDKPFDYKDWDFVQDYWIKYEGQFSQDSKNGEGKLYLSNGEIFEGSFKDDMVWGEGTLNKRDGNRVRGSWRENKLIRIY